MSRDLQVEIQTFLDDFEKETKDALKNSAKKVAQQGVDKLKSNSPKDRPEYYKGWSIKEQGNKLGTVSYVIHNKTNPGLTHLLENGHVSKNQYGTYKRVGAEKHIKPVEEWVKKEFEKEVRKVIGNIKV